MEIRRDYGEPYQSAGSGAQLIVIEYGLPLFRNRWKRFFGKELTFVAQRPSHRGVSRPLRAGLDSHESIYRKLINKGDVVPGKRAAWRGEKNSTPLRIVDEG